MPRRFTRRDFDFMLNKCNPDLMLDESTGEVVPKKRPGQVDQGE